MAFFSKIFFFLIFAVSLNGQDYSLIVNGGTGSGSYNIGDTVHIFADKTGVDSVFRSWSGNGTNYLNIREEWHAQFVVSENLNKDFELYANYDELPSGTRLLSESIPLFGVENGTIVEDLEKEVYLTMPENPKGIVFLFHGTGGNGAAMYENYETFSLIKQLYYSGFGVVSTDANERTLGDQDGDGKIRWMANNAIAQNLNNNIDLYNIQALKDTVKQRYSLPDQLPFFAYGVSNGANFGDLAAASLDFRASAHNTGNGSASLYAFHSNAKPVIWVQSENDQNSNADPELAYSNYQALIDRGICSQWNILKRAPLFEKRFMRSRNGIGIKKSREIYTALLDIPNLIDSDGFIIVDNVLNAIPDDFFIPFALNANQIKDIQTQLKVSNADHGATGDFNKTIVRFFQQQCVVSSENSTSDLPMKIELYPNPAQNVLFLKSDSGFVESAIIYNVSGQVVSHYVFDQTDKIISLDVLDFEAGFYFIKLKVKGKETVLKFVLS